MQAVSSGFSAGECVQQHMLMQDVAERNKRARGDEDTALAWKSFASKHDQLFSG